MTSLLEYSEALSVAWLNLSARERDLLAAVQVAWSAADETPVSDWESSRWSPVCRAAVDYLAGGAA